MTQSPTSQSRRFGHIAKSVDFWHHSLDVIPHSVHCFGVIALNTNQSRRWTVIVMWNPLRVAMSTSASRSCLCSNKLLVSIRALFWVMQTFLLSKMRSHTEGMSRRATHKRIWTWKHEVGPGLLWHTLGWQRSSMVNFAFFCHCLLSFGEICYWVLRTESTLGPHKCCEFWLRRYAVWPPNKVLAVSRAIGLLRSDTISLKHCCRGSTLVSAAVLCNIVRGSRNQVVGFSFISSRTRDCHRLLIVPPLLKLLQW